MKALRHGIVGLALLLVATRGVQAQVPTGGTAGAPSDSVVQANLGARDGTLAAKKVSTRGSFIGGVAMGLLGPFGLIVTVPIAHRKVLLGPSHDALMADTSQAYRNAFAEEYSDGVKSKRLRSAMFGMLITAVPLTILSLMIAGM
jgi:hypothetical protein